MKTRPGVWLVAAAMGIGCGRPARRSTEQPNVLLVTIDTLRADRVGTGVAPILDRLGSAGLRFTAARAAAPLTLPSHATIHTGLLPPEHGVRENGLGALAPSHRTLATLLRAAGYQTAAFVGAFVLDRRFGLGQGFETYDDQIRRDPSAAERLEAERPAAAVIDRALAWLAATSDDTAIRIPQSALRNPHPWFVWVHLYDPHAPYTPPAEFRARTTTPYDGEVAYADSQVGRLLDAIRTAGALDRTFIVVAGDHGEGLGDHGERTHGMLLFDSTLRVPLIIATPARNAATIDEPVSLSEIAPTILRAAGVTPPPEMKGRDLTAVRPTGGPAHTATGGGGRPDLYSETDYPRVAGWSTLQAVTDGRWKAIAAGGVTELYDLQNDPLEERDVASTQTTQALAMRARADAIHASGGSERATSISAEAQERLRALGYVASSAQTPSSRAPNPARTIGVWNQLEDALAALNAHQPIAASALERLAATNPGAPVIQTTYARALTDAGRPLAALAIYREASRRWPADGALLHDLAVAARDAAASADGPSANSLRDEAARAERAALAIDPDRATALNGLGLLAIDDHRPADAAQAFERAAALDANNASYWANLGNARRAVGDRARAEQAYRRALEVDGGTADAANGLGVLLVEANRPADAVAWFERALAAAPDLVEARLNLGIALQQAGDAKRAADTYRRVLAAPPRYKRERDAAAKLLASLGAR
jgi:arylsulfatase A-like enzyme